MAKQFATRKFLVMMRMIITSNDDRNWRNGYFVSYELLTTLPCHPTLKLKSQDSQDY
jgi:hypothetical protein